MKMYAIIEFVSITFTENEKSQTTKILDNAFYRTIEDACNKIDKLYNNALDYCDEDSITWVSKERKEEYGFTEVDYDPYIGSEITQYYIKEVEI